MASGKRASMREGPLAALFRKTETEGLRGAERRAPPRPPPRRGRRAAPAPAPRRAGAPPEPRVPTPQERLRHAFSSDLPENMMAPPARARRRRPRDYQWSSRAPESTPGQPQLRVVGVGGGGVNAVNRMIEAEIPGVEFLAFNTDAQSLQSSDAHVKLQLGARHHARPGLRLEPRPGARRGDGGLRPDQDAAARLGHGVHHRRRGRRHRHGRRARGGADRPRAGRADRRHRHEAVRLRGLAPPAGRRERHRGARGGGRHPHRGAEQPAAVACSTSRRR